MWNDLEMRALDWLYDIWPLPSGYAPSEQLSFEVWLGCPSAHGYEHFELLVHLAVEQTRAAGAERREIQPPIHVDMKGGPDWCLRVW